MEVVCINVVNVLIQHIDLTTLPATGNVFFISTRVLGFWEFAAVRGFKNKNI